MNWGKGIIIGMSLFMGFILFLVINLMTHKVDLESEDYYKKEIDYESEIQSLNNANALAQKVAFLQQSDFIIVQIPDSMDYSNMELLLRRPDNEKYDKLFKIAGTKSFLIPKDDLQKGKFEIRLTYSIESKDYLQKSTVYVQ